MSSKIRRCQSSFISLAPVTGRLLRRRGFFAAVLTLMGLRPAFKRLEGEDFGCFYLYPSDSVEWMIAFSGVEEVSNGSE